MNIAEFLSRQYPNPPCWHLVADMLGQVPSFVPVDATIASVAATFRLALHEGRHGFKRSEDPQEGCVVLMGRRAAHVPHHCGVYIEGRVLHALPSGNMYQDLASLGDIYERIEFWVRA